MTDKSVVVLFISLVLADLAYSIPKLERRLARKDKPGKRWARQGLPASVEDTDLLTTPQNNAVESDPDSDAQNDAPSDEDLNENDNGGLEENPQDLEKAYAGQEYVNQPDPGQSHLNAQNNDPLYADLNQYDNGGLEGNLHYPIYSDQDPYADQKYVNQTDPGLDAQNKAPLYEDLNQYGNGGLEGNPQGPIYPDQGQYGGQEYNYEYPGVGGGETVPNQKVNEYDGDYGNYGDVPNEEQTQLKQNFDYNYDAGNINYATRALQAGDIFTAQEMLPIAVKLMQKVREKGSGIVSSASHPKVLADTLFERFFVSTMKRIVVLEEIDIPGLDALQALALSGDVVGLRSSASSITETPTNERGEYLLEENPIRKCHYKFLRKRVNGNRKQNNPKRRQRVNLAKRLRKNRKVVINSARSGTARKNKSSPRNNTGLRQSKKSKTKISNRGNLNQNQTRIFRGNYKNGLIRNGKVGPKSNNTCRWLYGCTDSANLETCGLHTDCSEQAKSGRKYMGVKISYDENTDEMQQFRRKIGVDVIDEEVEKILEIRYKTQRLQSKVDEKVESLAEYFNKIVVREQLLETLYSSPNPMAGKVGDEMNYYDTATEPYYAMPPEQNYNAQYPQEYPAYGPNLLPNYGNVPAPEDAGSVDEAIMPAPDEVVPAPLNAGFVDEAIMPAPDEVMPDPQDAGLADEAIMPSPDEVVPAPQDTGSADEAILVMPGEDVPEENKGETTGALEAKRRILPGILKSNSTGVLPIKKS